MSEPGATDSHLSASSFDFEPSKTSHAAVVRCLFVNIWPNHKHAFSTYTLSVFVCSCILSKSK